MLRGRYGFGWTIAAWAAMAVVTIAVALWLGPLLARLMAGGKCKVLGFCTVKVRPQLSTKVSPPALTRCTCST